MGRGTSEEGRLGFATDIFEIGRGESRKGWKCWRWEAIVTQDNSVASEKLCPLKLLQNAFSYFFLPPFPYLPTLKFLPFPHLKAQDFVAWNDWKGKTADSSINHSVIIQLVFPLPLQPNIIPFLSTFSLVFSRLAFPPLSFSFYSFYSRKMSIFPFISLFVPLSFCLFNFCTFLNQGKNYQKLISKLLILGR